MYEDYVARRRTDGKARLLCAFLVLLLLNLGVTGCGEQVLMSAEIVTYETSKETIQPDSPATASVRIKNTSPEDGTLWIGYSVQGPMGSGQAHEALRQRLVPPVAER